MLVKNVNTGWRFSAPKDEETSETHEIEKEQLSYNTDEFVLTDLISTLEMKVIEQEGDFTVPTHRFAAFTGLGETDLAAVEAQHLLHKTLVACELV